MCGPTASETALQGSEASFANTLQSNYQTQYGNQAELLSKLNSTLTPIVGAGPGQTGWTPQEAAAVNTGILEKTGANYSNAARAVNSQLAGRNNPTGLVSGIDQQIRGSLASSAARDISNQENAATIANYNQGNENFWRATGGAQALAGEYAPTSYAGLGTSANSSAFGESDTIQQQKNALAKDIVGGITGLAGGALKMFTGGLFGGGGGSVGSDVGGGASGGDEFAEEDQG